jgi:hypothetical protein
LAAFTPPFQLAHERASSDQVSSSEKVVASIGPGRGLGRVIEWRFYLVGPPGAAVCDRDIRGRDLRFCTLEITPEGGGLLHWLRIDLSAPGIELYVTPLDPAAVAQGWQYRLRPIKEVIASEGLAVAINGTLFTWDGPRWLPRSGDLARAVETVVADHVVSHVWDHSYLLWFDGQLTPHLIAAKPPQPSELAMARWGIGGQGVGLQHGQVWPGSSRDPDARTAVAIDQARKLLFLAVAENMSSRRLLQELADLGGKEGMLLDGGHSSALAIGEGSQAIAPGILYGGWRPVATYFGVRARPVRKKADD